MKKLNKQGFTLAELLIVVAIIAVLVAISIPVFSAQLEKSREQTDTANLRAVKAAAIVGAMDWKVDVDGVMTKITSTSAASTGTFYYDANKGTFLKSSKVTSIARYGKGTATKGGCEDFLLTTDPSASTKYYKQSTNAQNMIIQCVFKKGTSSKEPTYTLSWQDKGKS